MHVIDGPALWGQHWHGASFNVLGLQVSRAPLFAPPCPLLLLTPQLCRSNIADLQGRLGELMKFEGANPQYMMVQRCSFCLQGVSAGIGMPGINALPLLRPAAEKFLKDNNLTDEWQPGDVHVNFKRRNSRVVRD